jgi:hypothetical protein
MPKKPAEPEVISSVDLLHPRGKQFWLKDSMFRTDEKTGLLEPSFSVQEVARCFLGVKPDWLRWRMRSDRTAESHGQPPLLSLDGKSLEFKRRNPEDPKSGRYYTLADIERVAHALCQGGYISGTDLAHVVLMVRTCARLHGIQ